jgi:cytochrome P450
LTTFTAAPSAQQAKQPTTPPETRIPDLLRLAGRLLPALLTGGRARAGVVVSSWMNGLLQRYHSRAVIVKVGRKRILIAADAELSRAVLEPPPGTSTFVAGSLKADAMSFLAPHALTIAHGADWSALRKFNEQVLSTGCPHMHAAAFLAAVHASFSGPITTVPDVRAALARSMLRIVLGNRANPRIADDVQQLFRLVQSPLRRRLAGKRGRDLRERFYSDLRAALQANAATDPSLAGSARQFGDVIEPQDVLEQMPHWMFTFTGSGTDLLVRAYALICARPQVRARVQQEIAVAGSLDDPRSVARMPYLEACLREAGRLFPPVTKTFHRAPGGTNAAGYRIGSDVEVLHYLPLVYRVATDAPDAHNFRPERWLSSSAGGRPYPDMFMSGARACPGQDLILFVCKAAIATLLARGTTADNRKLTNDPLPLFFPDKETRFYDAGHH